LLTLNVPLQIDKCTTKGTCTPGGEPLFWNLGFKTGGIERFAKEWEYGGDISFKSPIILVYCFCQS